MQVLVLYHSKTGRTKALAEAIAEGVARADDVSALLRSVDEVAEADFLESDGIIAGSPVYFGLMSAELKGVFDRFIRIRKQMAGKVGAAFATSHHPTGGKETTMMSILQAMLIYGMIVVGDPISIGGHFGVAFSGAGDLPSDELEQAQELGVRVAEIVRKLN